MNLELADYQRSLQALEERLKTAQVELEQEKEGGRKQLEKTDSLRKEIGEHSLILPSTLSCPLYDVQTYKLSSVLQQKTDCLRPRHCG